MKDIKGIFVFDKEGRFKNEIGRRGNGPGEYFYIDNFYLDRKISLFVSFLMQRSKYCNMIMMEIMFLLFTLMKMI